MVRGFVRPGSVVRGLRSWAGFGWGRRGQLQHIVEQIVRSGSRRWDSRRPGSPAALSQASGLQAIAQFNRQQRIETQLQKALARVDRAGRLTPNGRKLLAVTKVRQMLQER